MNTEKVMVTGDGPSFEKANAISKALYQPQQAITVPFDIKTEDGKTPTPEQLTEAQDIMAQAMEQAEANGVTIDPRVVKNVGMYESQQAYKFRKILLHTIPQGENSIKTNIQVSRCGHKINIQNQPKSNCNHCWDTYWKTHPGQVVAGKSALETVGSLAIRTAYGRKYLNQLRRVLSV